MTQQRKESGISSSEPCLTVILGFQTKYNRRSFFPSASRISATFQIKIIGDRYFAKYQACWHVFPLISDTLKLIHSFNFMPIFPLGRVAGAAALGGLEIPHGQQLSQTVVLAPHQNGTKQGRILVTPPGPWTTS